MSNLISALQTVAGLPPEALQLLPGATEGAPAPATPGISVQPTTAAPMSPGGQGLLPQRPMTTSRDADGDLISHFPVDNVDCGCEPVFGPASSPFSRY